MQANPIFSTLWHYDDGLNNWLLNGAFSTCSNIYSLIVYKSFKVSAVVINEDNLHYEKIKLDAKNIQVTAVSVTTKFRKITVVI